MYTFIDREEAGRLLAMLLLKYKESNAIVMAVPRGGVPVAYEVATRLNLPMDIVFTRKIGNPLNKEYAIGAASLTDYFIIREKEVTDDYIKSEVKKVQNRLKEMKEKFDRYLQHRDPAGKTLIVIDDGVATGNTLLATVQMLRKSRPAKIVIAVPVAPPQTVKELAKIADEVITVHTEEPFYGVGWFYMNFDQVNDEEVIHILDKQRVLPVD
jgi:putative phosphoribosyl transferase